MQARLQGLSVIMSSVEGARNDRAIHDALTAHAYFQFWPQDDGSKKWIPAPEGMIAGPGRLCGQDR